MHGRVDNLSPAYDVRMKHYRLKSLREPANLHFLQDDITDKAIPERLDASVPAVEAVINLAAVAGVRAVMKTLELPVHQHARCAEYAGILRARRRESSSWHPPAACTETKARLSMPKALPATIRSRRMPPARRARRLLRMPITTCTGWMCPCCATSRFTACRAAGYGHVPLRCGSRKGAPGVRDWRRRAVARLHIRGRHCADDAGALGPSGTTSSTWAGTR